LPQFFHLGSLSAAGFFQTLIEQLAKLGLKMTMVLGFVACVDMVFVKREFSQRMRMSRREITEERKQHEGHPRIRARLRALRMELRKRSRSIAQTKNADVLITNPTHIAIALCYRHGEMVAPQCVAKGAGMAASMMRAIAAKHQIPIVQNRHLARALFRKVDFNQSVPSELYAEVARIIVWVFAMRRPTVTPSMNGGIQ
jgi:flagellar biosynthetic protein FlhB